MRNHGVCVVVCCTLLFSRDVGGGCGVLLIFHRCDDIAVVIQSMTSDCALLSSLFLSSSPLGCFCVGVCVCVCVCGVTGTGCDCDREAVSSRRLGGRDRGETHSGAIDVIAAPGPRHSPLSSMCLCVGVCACVYFLVFVCADCCFWSPRRLLPVDEG